MNKLSVLLLALLPACSLATSFDKAFNSVYPSGDVRLSKHAQELHAKLTIVDWHADTLLWERDVTERVDWGHVDVPRLVDGNVAIQAFTIVTKVPVMAKNNNNPSNTDMITPLAIFEGWPFKAWTSLAERTFVQTGKLHDAVYKSNGRFVLIRTRADLDAFLERRKSDPTLVAGFLGVEGAHALDGKLANVSRFYNVDVRMMAPTHFFDNDIGGSAHGQVKAGLTAKGKAMIRLMQEQKMIIDLAHASSAVVDDVLALATRPVVVSHTGVRGTCDNQRNLTDAQAKGIAATGGVIGIGYFEMAVCGKDPAAIAKAMRYTANLVGAEHVALGSDFDGLVKTPFDTSGLIRLTDAMLSEGFSDAEIAQIMGESSVRVLRAALP
jgi:microsomal dipeptidase-like Zn-dependent dipeptidase